MRGKLQGPLFEALIAFNEARALCAGNFECSRGERFMRGKLCPSTVGKPFNEARALCAGNCRARTFGRSSYVPSMRPALYARETPTILLRVQWLRTPTILPSMRPALYARETPCACFRDTPSARCKVTSFNEARALCAGNSAPIPAPLWRETSAPHRPFNEARALCAGNFPPCDRRGRGPP